MALSSVHGEDRARVRRGTMKRPASSAPATHDDEATPRQTDGSGLFITHAGHHARHPGMQRAMRPVVPCGVRPATPAEDRGVSGNDAPDED